MKQWNCIKHKTGGIDTRYTVKMEWCGYSYVRYVARFCGEYVGTSDDRRGAWELAKEHSNKQTEKGSN